MTTTPGRHCDRPEAAIEINATTAVSLPIASISMPKNVPPTFHQRSLNNITSYRQQNALGGDAVLPLLLGPPLGHIILKLAVFLIFRRGRCDLLQGLEITRDEERVALGVGSQAAGVHVPWQPVIAPVDRGKNKIGGQSCRRGYADG